MTNIPVVRKHKPSVKVRTYLLVIVWQRFWCDIQKIVVFVASFFKKPGLLLCFVTVFNLQQQTTSILHKMDTHPFDDFYCHKSQIIVCIFTIKSTFSLSDTFPKDTFQQIKYFPTKTFSNIGILT